VKVVQLIDIVRPRTGAYLAVALLATVALASDPGRRDDPPRWASHPLVRVSGAVVDDMLRRHEAPIRFQIDLPVGFVMTKWTSPGNLDWGTRFLGEHFHDPHVIVRFDGLPASLDDAITMLVGSGDQIVRAEATRTGFLVSGRQGDRVVRTLAWNRLSDRESVTCYAMQARRDRLRDVEGTQAWLERICRSLVLVR
jgi:hypothetical protein